MNNLVAGQADDVDYARSRLGTCGDVIEDELIDALAVVEPGQRDGISDIDVVEELHTLGHPSPVHVEARDHAGGQRHFRVLREVMATASLAMASSREQIRS